MVMETSGAMQKDCAIAIKEFIRAARHSGVWAPASLVHGIRSSLAVAVQRGNAAIVSAGLRAANPLA